MTTSSTIDDAPALFDTIDELEQKVRSNDPETSWAAARSITRAELHGLKAEIHHILASAGRPLTHDELYARYIADGGSRTAQRVRTACTEMSRTRNVRTGIEETPSIRQAEGMGVSENGGEATLWEVIR